MQIKIFFDCESSIQLEYASFNFTQAELNRLPAFKLPSDKVDCVSRVAATVMNLLSLASDKSVPAADDFLPVFVYVIIQANPPSLLSTG